MLGGGGFASILTDEVRQKRGYVYGISSHFGPMAAGGPFQVRLQTGNDNADDALTLTLDLIDQFVQDGPTAEQLEETRREQYRIFDESFSIESYHARFRSLMEGGDGRL